MVGSLAWCSLSMSSTRLAALRKKKRRSRERKEKFISPVKKACKKFVSEMVAIKNALFFGYWHHDIFSDGQFTYRLKNNHHGNKTSKLSLA